MRIWDGFCMTVGISAASLVASLALGVLVVSGPGRALPVAALSVRLLRNSSGRHAAHRASVLLTTSSVSALGVHRQPGAGGHSHPVAVLGVTSPKSCAQLAVAGRGQMEAARAVGFTRAQTLRYVWRCSWWPARCRRSRVRWSTLATRRCCRSIAVIELTQTMREITATNHNFFGGFLLLGALYLRSRCSIMAVSRHFEKRLDHA